MADDPWARFKDAPSPTTDDPWARFQDAPKQRSWSDVPGEAVRNLPASAKKFATDIVEPFLSPVETVKNLADAAAGGLRAGARAVLPEGAFNAIDGIGNQEANQRIEKTASGVGQFFSDRYGSVDAIKNTLATDPVGAAGDAALALTGGGAVAARAPGVVGRAGQAVRAAGEAIDPVLATARAAAPVAKVGGHLASGVLGLTTGAGQRPVQEAFRAGREGNTTFVDHMRGGAPIDDVVNMASSGVNAMGRERSAAYQAGIQSTRENKTAIRLGPVVDSIRRAHDDLVYRVGEQTHVKNAEAMKALGEVADQVQNLRQMDYHAGGRTPEALDALKQSIGGVLEKQKQGTVAHRVVGQIYNDVKQLIVDTVPEYAKTMKDYERASDNIREMRSTLSLNNRASTDTTLRKLQSTMRNNVNTNYGKRTAMLDELAQTQPDLPAALAGQSMSSVLPRGIGNIPAGYGVWNAAQAGFTPSSLAMLPFASPRAVGEGAYALGQGAQVVGDIGSAVASSPLMDLIMSAYYGGNAMRSVKDQNGREQR